MTLVLVKTGAQGVTLVLVKTGAQGVTLVLVKTGAQGVTSELKTAVVVSIVTIIHQAINVWELKQ